MKVTVVGAGKMGLPLACQFANLGAEVIACDVSQKVVDALNRGECLIDEPGIPEMVAATHAAGRLRATTDTTTAVAESEVVVIIVPAVLTETREIDVSILQSASRQVAKGLKPGMMVCYETTMPVGGTRRFLQPVLEESGLKAGVDFDLVFSPERVKSQKVLKHLTINPKIVGGVTPAAAARAERFYADYLGAPVINLQTLEASEFAKLAGMLYRDVNIGLANELGRYAELAGVDLGPVIEAANTDGESYLLRPGIGVGGHCTPVYPYFLINDARQLGAPATLVERSRRINDAQPGYQLDRVEAGWQGLQGKNVLILGLGFRPQVKEHIFSPAFLLQEELEARGACATLHDPLYSEEEIRAHGFKPGDFDSPTPELIVLNTSHDAYKALDFEALAKKGVKAVLDGRNLWSPEQVEAAGLTYFGIGRGAVRKPASTTIQMAKPVLAGEEAEAAAEAVRSGWVVQGPRVAAFEKEFGAYVGAPFACAVSSGTSALHLALEVLGVKPGDEVITVSHSYIATANAVLYCGAKPVFVDIDPRTYNLDPALLEAAITPKTKAILTVHQIGMPCAMGPILKIAAAHNLPVVEDAACAIGSEIYFDGVWQRIGAPLGDIATFSFHPRKLLTTGDGGMITTRNPEYDRQFRLLRSHGMSVSAHDRHAAKSIMFEAYPVVGYNYRMTEIQAAVGREQLKRISWMVGERRRIASCYTAAIREIRGLEPPCEPVDCRTNWQSYAVRITDEASLTRDALMQRLFDAGIQTRRGVMNAHQEPAYREYASLSLPHSEASRDQVILLPLYPTMTSEEIDRVIAALHEAVH